MRFRLKPRTPEEFAVLIGLVSRRIHDVECGVAYRFEHRKKKDAVWSSITQDFNATKKVTREASSIELRAIWSRIKNKVKKQRKKVGPTAPLTDWVTAAAEKIMQKASKATTPIRTPYQTPPHSALDDFATDSDASPSGLRESLDPGDRPRIESRPAGRSSTAVDYCPRKQFVTPDRKTSFSLGKQGLLAMPGSRPAGSQTQNRKPQSVLHQTFPLPTAFKTAPKTSTAASSLPSNVSFFRPGVNPAPSKFYQGPNNAVWTLGNLPTPVPHQQQTPGIPSPVRILTQSTVMEDSSRSQLQNVQAQLQIRQVQALAAMEKALHENKMRSEEITRSLAQTLHDAQMKANSASAEGHQALNDMLLKRGEELHKARLRVEEEALSLQRQLYEIKMETAKIELDQAEMARLIIKKKLQLADLELQQMEKSGWYSPRAQGS